jgi:hypothetical protein
MKHRCAVCKKKVGLGVRFRNLWNGFGWTHVRFCGAKCEKRFEQDKKDAVLRLRWNRYLARGSPQT